MLLNFFSTYDSNLSVKFIVPRYIDIETISTNKIFIENKLYKMYLQIFLVCVCVYNLLLKRKTNLHTNEIHVLAYVVLHDVKHL